MAEEKWYAMATLLPWRWSKRPTCPPCFSLESEVSGVCDIIFNAGWRSTDVSDKQGREKQAIAFCGLPAFPIMCCVCRRAYTGRFVGWHKNLFLPSDSGELGIYLRPCQCSLNTKGLEAVCLKKPMIVNQEDGGTKRLQEKSRIYRVFDGFDDVEN